MTDALTRPLNPAALTAIEARALFRNGLVTPTAGWAAGFTQANLIIVPREQAFDVLLFAQRNPKSCPLLGVLDAGETSGALLAGGDIRTDVPRYTVYEHGVKVAEPTDITTWWRDDLVTFMIGCSFTFEAALQVWAVGCFDAAGPAVAGIRRGADHLPLPGGPRCTGARGRPVPTGNHGPFRAGFR